MNVCSYNEAKKEDKTCKEIKVNNVVAFDASDECSENEACTVRYEISVKSTANKCSGKKKFFVAGIVSFNWFYFGRTGLQIPRSSQNKRTVNVGDKFRVIDCLAYLALTDSLPRIGALSEIEEQFRL